MKKKLVTLIASVFITTFLFSQNSFRSGDGWFGESGWYSHSYFSPNIGTTYSFTTTPNGTGYQYFRIATNWDGSTEVHGPSSDTQLNTNTEYTLTDDGESFAHYINVPNSSYYYVFKTPYGNGHTTPKVFIMEFQSAPVLIGHFDESGGGGGDNTPFDGQFGNSLFFKIDCGVVAPPVDQKYCVVYEVDDVNINDKTIVCTTGTSGQQGSNYYSLVHFEKPASGTTLHYYTISTEANVNVTSANADWVTVTYDTGVARANYSVDLGSLSTDDILQPSSIQISNIYPNPFNPSTAIEYEVAVAGEINISIYNLQGQLVKTLVNQNKYAGNHSVVWDASGQPNGQYFVKLIAGGEQQVEKMILLK